MTHRIVYNYSVLRFLPYPEVGEFMNAGVLVHSPETGFLGFEVKRQATKRLSGFFPELKKDVYRHAIRSWADEVTRIQGLLKKTTFKADDLFFDPTDSNHCFRELIRPRESILRMSEPHTLFTALPPAKVVERVFNDYVERMFAKPHEYQETIIAE